jgi:hypothetical protein
MELIELGAFSGVPNGPGVKRLEVAASKGTEGTFGSSDGF